MRDKRDIKKKRFIEALTLKGTVYHAAKAAGVSRQTVYRWREEDSEFADVWEEAIENAVDEVESTIYHQAVGGNTLAAIFYLKAHRPIYRDRLNIDIEQLRGEIEERIAQLTATGELVPRAIERFKTEENCAHRECKTRRRKLNSIAPHRPLRIACDNVTVEKTTYRRCLKVKT